MIFHNTSNECYYWLKEQPNVKEESLTDWILYTISKRTNRFKYYAFKRNEEAYTGADWEWWFLVDDYLKFKAYRFLVQAKKLKNKGDNYPLISYGNKNGLQIDLLIDSSNKRNAMPLYIFYSLANPQITQQIKNFHFIPENIVTWCENCINGAHISMAHKVKKDIFDSPRKKISEVDVLNSSLGLSMLDLLFNPKFSPKKIMKALDIYYIKYLSDKSFTPHNSIEHSGSSIPDYLKIFINQNINHISWYESEFQHSFSNLSGIAVLDLTEDQYLKN